MPLRWEGRVWPLVDTNGDLLDDIDTDQIYHNAHLAVTDMAEMGRYALGNLEGYGDFASSACPGDIVVAGENFGAGSSRQQAVDCFVSLGISCIAARSFGAIYWRNAINAGFPVHRITEIDLSRVERGDVIVVDADAGLMEREGEVFGRLRPMPSVQREILDAGNLFLYAKRMKGNREIH
ncbi:MAG TPA: 3-isopropylmalate dehydratase [Thermoplasmata archaeon]|nr:3-isopropylmalate dehydratase [Thermoplasmata archaeon]